MDYVAGHGANPHGHVSCLSGLRIVPESSGKGIDFRKVKTESEIGSFKAKLPLVLYSSSFSTQADFAKLAEGAALAGIPLAIGENSMAAFGAKGLKERVKAYLDNTSKKFGAVIVEANQHDLQQKAFEKAAEFGASGLQLSLGHSKNISCCTKLNLSDAKEADKLEKAGYLLFKDGNSQHCHSLPAAVSEEELKEKLLKYSELELPIWIRLSLGAGITKLILSLQKIKRENEIPLKCLTVDGTCGRQEASCWPPLKECGLPSAFLFGVLDERPSFDIILAGDYSCGIEAAKAMMLGAKGVELSHSFAETASAMKEGKKNSIECLAKTIEKELQFFCAIQRVESTEELHRKKKNLLALSKECSEMFGVSSNPKTIL